MDICLCTSHNTMYTVQCKYMHWLLVRSIYIFVKGEGSMISKARGLEYTDYLATQLFPSTKFLVTNHDINPVINHNNI